MSKRKEAQDEVCYSSSPRGVRTTRRQDGSAHCPYMPHTYTHVRQKAGSSTAEPNMLQNLPKKSENECKLRLFYPPLPHCLTLVIKSLSAVMGVHSTLTTQVPPEEQVRNRELELLLAKLTSFLTQISHHTKSKIKQLLIMYI